MDNKVKQALEFSNYRQTLNNQLQQLKIRCQTQLLFSCGGGIFTIDRALISFVQALINKEQESAVLLDDNDTPILIENLVDFLDNIIVRYYEIVNDYHEQYERVRQSRKVQTIVDLDI